MTTKCQHLDTNSPGHITIMIAKDLEIKLAASGTQSLQNFSFIVEAVVAFGGVNPLFPIEKYIFQIRYVKVNPGSSFE